MNTKFQLRLFRSYLPVRSRHSVSFIHSSKLCYPNWNSLYLLFCVFIKLTSLFMNVVWYWHSIQRTNERIFHVAPTYVLVRIMRRWLKFWFFLAHFFQDRTKAFKIATGVIHAYLSVPLSPMNFHLTPNSKFLSFILLSYW